MKKICIGIVGIVVVVALVWIVKAGRSQTTTDTTPQQNTTTTAQSGDGFTANVPVAFMKIQEPAVQVGTDKLPTALSHSTFTLDPENPESGMLNIYLFGDEGLKLPQWEATYLDFTQYDMIATFMTDGWVGDEVKFLKGLPEDSFGKVFMADRDGTVVYLQMVTTKDYRDATEYAYQVFLGSLKLSSLQE